MIRSYTVVVGVVVLKVLSALCRIDWKFNVHVLCPGAGTTSDSLSCCHIVLRARWIPVCGSLRYHDSWRRDMVVLSTEC